MDTRPRSFAATLKHPTGFLPIAMSLTALAIVLGHIAFFGTAREADEGTDALIWQLLMAGQLPVLLLFANPVAAQSSETISLCACTASRSSALCNGSRFLSQFVMRTRA
jgi:hypothetical protein